MSLFQLVHVSHRAKLSWITASHQLLLGGNTLPSERGGIGKRDGGRADILQLLLILTTGEATFQVKQNKNCDKYKSERNVYGSSGSSDRSDTINFQIDLVG